MEKTFFDVRVFNPHATSNRNQTSSACYRKHEKEKKRAYAQRILEVEHSSFTPLVFSATGGIGRETTCFYKRHGFHARSEVGSLIQHHSLLAEMPIDLLPYLLSHTIPTRSKIFSTSCCPLPSSNRPRHHWVPYHTRLLNPLFHLKVSFFLSLLCRFCEYSCSSFVVHLIQHYFQFFSFPRWRV